LEDWIENDISIISSGLLLIGRQVETRYGGLIDILCIDHKGDIIIVELKRDKTPREITAQVLDYASWIRNLTAEQIQDIARNYFKSELEDAFESKFGFDLPESINQEHEMLVVGSEIDNASQRIINYLSESYGVAINAITFNYFMDGNCEYLARTFLIEPSKAEIQQQTRQGKRLPNLTEEQLQAIADENEVGGLYRQLLEGLTPLFYSPRPTRSTIAFKGIVQGKRRVILSLVPGESNSEKGLKFRVYVERLSKHQKISEEEVIEILPKNKTPWKYYENAPSDLCGYEGFFENSDEISNFLRVLKKQIE
ncbi:MAG: endonuclease NucS, partial [Flavobacteriaceae bacterium]